MLPDSLYNTVYSFPPKFKILCRTLTTYSTLCWLLVPTVLPEGCSESAKENRKITGCTRAAQASELSQAEIQLNEIGYKISNSCFQALPTKEGESLGMRLGGTHAE